MAWRSLKSMTCVLYTRCSTRTPACIRVPTTVRMQHLMRAARFDFRCARHVSLVGLARISCASRESRARGVSCARGTRLLRAACLVRATRARGVARLDSRAGRHTDRSSHTGRPTRRALDGTLALSCARGMSRALVRARHVSCASALALISCALRVSCQKTRVKRREPSRQLSKKEHLRKTTAIDWLR